MCGISGIYDHGNITRAKDALAAMNDAMKHRGPDDDGIYADELVALGHRRLSIIDLSSAGHQPMRSSDGNIEIVYNGEIYNYREVRDVLGKESFSTATDTEVIIRAWQKWGASCLEHLNGMFAFAIWDRSSGELFIARDRLGIKPLYYYHKDNILVFASEIRTLLRSGYVPAIIDRDALTDYFTYQTVHAPQTIIKDVNMLLPGHYLSVRNKEFTTTCYWNLIDDAGSGNDYSSYDVVKGRINELFSEAVRKRLVSDVPFGAFLSGGIDSSAVVGYMSRFLDNPVRTFHISFDESEFSEARYAKMVAEKFHTDHHEFRLTPADFLQKLPDALRALDHPSGDGPNSWLVSKITRENGVTMALSGLGGDELFAGYPVFKRIPQIRSMKWLWMLPASARMALANVISKGKPKAHRMKLRELLSLPVNSIGASLPLFRQISGRTHVSSLINHQLAADSLSSMMDMGYKNGLGELPELSQISYGEISAYMQNILLRDTDQMSMASALEVRVPFLDHDLVEYVMGIPDRFKKPHTPKKLLLDSLGELLPPEIVNRPKMGFTFPWNHWLKNELREFCSDRIHALSKREFMNGETLLTRWNSFISNDGAVRWPEMWIAVVLEEWMEQNKVEN
jgi:asparagine synthase (glutamine-hydrolysing)